MALTRVRTQIQWSSANYKTVSANTIQWSDAFTFDTTDVGCSLSVRADNQGTPASGDTCDVYIAWTTGDVSGGGGSDTYDTDEHSQFVFRLDTYGTNTPGEDPAAKSVDLPVSAKGMKIGVICAQASTRNVKVEAAVMTQRAA